MSTSIQKNNLSEKIFNSIENIKGIGPKTVKLIKDKIGLRVIDHLLNLPTKYINRYQKTSIKNSVKGDYITVDVVIVEMNIKKGFFKRRIPSRIITFGLNEESNQRLDIVYFNLYSNSFSKLYKINNEYTVSGKVEIFKGIPQITHPDYFIPKELNYKIPKYDPIYRMPNGIKKNQINNIINYGLENLNNLEEWSRDETIKKFNFLSFSNTIKTLHMPKEQEFYNQESNLIKRLAHDELLSNFISLMILKNKMQANNSGILENDLNTLLLKNLNFELTEDQIKVINEISDDLKSNKPMLRLLQGDVGSGKTIVAIFAIIQVIGSGYQAALMAPTEVLAQQHYQNLKQLIKNLDIEITLIVGKQSAKLKKENYENVKNGKSKIIIGTHALTSKGLIYKNLKLAVIDEQHRFGVNQRISIVEKGKDINLLVMTATPIPRSLALTYYNDMSVSNIKMKPKGRKNIDTSLISIKKLDSLIKGLKRRISEGSQIYWICPAIEFNEDTTNLTSIEEREKYLSKYFKSTEFNIVHGKQKSEERDIIINNFKDGNSRILLATTVVEVGIDVPNADIIIIESANRYGLAQLHQLRGRVGRSDKQSYCILLYENQLSEIAEKRLNTLKSTNDGFIIAEKDLILRGPGEVLGVRQSGDANFRFVNLILHKDLIENAKSEAEFLFNNSEINSKKLEQLNEIFQNKNALISLGG
ncbi:MAG: ATP-dependent DNA helicase RecG [Alphaproteobacteria bacterium]|nr:MAG: ATP-dependent DNA helicase RecG [Alphaproteobacteria bacterium]